MLKYLMLGVAGVFAVVVIAYIIIYKKMQNKETKYVAQLVEGTKASSVSMEIFYQKFYIYCSKIPVIKRYAYKLRRRLEIINIDDEYNTRKQVGQMMLRAICIVFPLTLAIVLLTKKDTMLMLSLLLFEVFFIESLMEGFVDKVDNQLLREQIDFFAEIRHAYHEYNMVEEAIYEVAQNDEVKVSRQAEKIYEILISDDPEMELEKYYDIAPNSFLKEFAGISYLTREFGDRKDKDGASLYLKNLNNITQEMQIEILKRDKLDYVFQSLSMIAAVPVLFINAVKSWAISQFSFTSQFYNGTLGFYVEVFLLVLTYISYLLTRKLKDNGSVKVNQNTENPWQAKLYKHASIKKVMSYLIPKTGTKEYRKIVKLLKDSASKLKIEWLYINRVAAAIATFIVALFVFFEAHAMSIHYIYNEPTSDYNLVGQMSATQEKDAMETTYRHNKFIDMFKTDLKTTEDDIEKALSKDDYYKGYSDEDLEKEAGKIYDKLKTVQSQNFKWFELLISFGLAFLGYYGPVLLLVFQRVMRQMDMENEVMQFQTIILMLMKIERVNVEMILEWLERYSNIFREPISKCVNNYESGPWEALEELKNDVTFTQFIRIIESLQAAVEKIPIREAFDELDTERAYHQEKRKESNERTISRKSIIGKVIGFAPMVMLFVAYLIVPLCVIGLLSMTDAFSTMSSQM